jgi:hypothetical protein
MVIAAKTIIPKQIAKIYFDFEFIKILLDYSTSGKI